MNTTKNPLISKTSQAVDIWLSGDKNKALGIFKTFRLDVTKDEKTILEIAHEINTGNGAFYTKMGYNTQEVMTQAEAIIVAKWIKN